jgi:hypothetical protein
MQQNRKLLLADNAEEYENDCCVGDSKPGCQNNEEDAIFSPAGSITRERAFTLEPALSFQQTCWIR